MADQPAALAPGATIGILGGGQLGRMLALAAARLGLHVHVLSDRGDDPALEVARQGIHADYDDLDAIARFAGSVDVLTYEFENVPLATADAAALHAPLRPSRRALEATQDRLLERELVLSVGHRVAPFAPVAHEADIAKALAHIGAPALLKTRRFGYDGKGQVRLEDARPEIGVAAWHSIGSAPAILEARVDFARELSVVATRGLDGSIVNYDLAENEHRDQILRVSRLPATVDAGTADLARAIARDLLEALDYVGTLAVELFHVPHDPLGPLIVNELAPRVHNSGHWTEDAALTSQFENHVRAIAGWPLGATDRIGPVTMTNLIGHEADRWRELASDPRNRLHLYGKAVARPGRKMGHVNRLELANRRNGDAD
ncbi:MAG: 5-(carboxyamino)imidazole ribonucleotide synthase [Rhizobiales bacterium]|nr:5-(carboxyamino)imidazole ribonucleotide synthase [Hyphomicrobiales bacterium]